MEESKEKKTVVPKNSNAPIKQTETNLFDRGTWGLLSEVEASTKPQPVPTSKNIEVPFFNQHHEKASVTLFDAFGQAENKARGKRDVQNRK